MALRNIVEQGDPILEKKCRKVEKFDEKLSILIDDMIETMRENEGVGIAAPQVGMLRRVCVIEPEKEDVYELINPEIVESSGEQEEYEGCLSVPGVVGKVKRPESVTVRFQDRSGSEQTLIFEGFAAVAASHEMDHLDGILYTTKASDVHDPIKRKAELEAMNTESEEEAESL